MERKKKGERSGERERERMRGKVDSNFLIENLNSFPFFISEWLQKQKNTQGLLFFIRNVHTVVKISLYY